MKGYLAALCLPLLLGVAGAASATQAVVDFQDTTKSSNAKVLDTADGKLTQVTVGGRKAVQTGGSNGTNGYIYVSLPKDLFKDAKAVWAQVEYFDQGTDTFQLEYDSKNGTDQSAEANPVTKHDTKAWATHTFILRDFNLQAGDANGADLQINDLGDGPEIIDKIIVTDLDPDKIHFPHVDPAHPVTIDGVINPGEWDNAYKVTLDTAAQDALAGVNWGGKEDFSGTYSYLWDEKGLYVLGQVVDATPRLNDQSGDRAWSGDGIEEFISLDRSDPNHDQYIEGVDYHVFIGMGDTPMWGFQFAGESGEDRGKIPAEDLAIKNTDSPKGYMFEFLLPWAQLNKDFKPKTGQDIGWFMFANNSKDLPSTQAVAMSPFKRTGPSGHPAVWASVTLDPVLQQPVTNPPTAGQ
jgi:hypothetical protein